MRLAEIQVGLLGLGLWGTNLARAFAAARGCRLRVACDLDRARLEAAASRGEAEQYTPNPADVLRAPDLDAVVVATSPRTHADLTCQALSAGKHVFVEKPLALTLSDAKRVEHAARHASLRVMVGHILRYHPAIVELAQLLERGEFGRVRRVVSERFASPQAYRKENAWWTLAAHDLSLLELLADTELDRGTIALFDCDDRATGDHVSARLSFPDGPTAQIELSCNHAVKHRCLRVFTDRYRIVFDDVVHPSTLKLFDKGLSRSRALRTWDLPAVEPLLLEAQHFIDALIGGTPFRTDVTEGVRVVRALEVGMRSLHLGSTALSIGSFDAHSVERRQGTPLAAE